MKQNNPIQTMLQEHDTIMKAEQVIDKIESLWDQNSSEYERAVRQLLQFFKEYSDQYHHHKEEEILFPDMNDHPDFMHQELIEELLDHHTFFREMVAEIKNLLGSKEWPKAHKVLKMYINNLLDHIAAENDELFNMAETLFSEEELERIYFRFQDIDDELGIERKTELENMLNNF